MRAMSVNVRNEPALAVAVFQAVIAMAVSFGLNLSAEQVGTVVALAAAVSALFVRQHVEPLSPDGRRAPETAPEALPGATESPPARVPGQPRASSPVSAPSPG